MADPAPSPVYSSFLTSHQLEAVGERIPSVILATLAVICRFLSRKLKKAAIGADDYMVVVGLVCTLTLLFVSARELK